MFDSNRMDFDAIVKIEKDLIHQRQKYVYLERDGVRHEEGNLWIFSWISLDFII